MADLDIKTPMGSETINESTEALEINQGTELELDDIDTGLKTGEESKETKSDGKEDGTNPGIKKEFAKLRKERRDMREELDQLRAQVQSASKKPEHKQYTREDFGNDEEAYINYKVEQGLRAQMQAQHTAAQEAYRKQSAQTQELSNWQKKIDSFAPELPNYAETVTEAAEGLNLSGTDIQNIMESPIGPKVIYTLSTNEAVADQFEKLTSQRARDRFLTKLEIQLEMQPSAAKSKPISNAPKPTPKLSGGKDSRHTKNPSEMTMEEFVAWRNS